MIRSLVVVLALASFAGCKKSDDPKAAPAAAKVEATRAQAGSDPKALCVDVMTRARACTDQYIPALVDSRAKLDQPPGIADAVKKDRNAVIQEALGEWKNDSQDAAISATCDKMATAQDAADADAAKQCLAKADCAAFTTCIMPLFEKRFAK